MNDLFEFEDRELYIEAMNALTDAGVQFMVGGAFAVYHYTNWWRNTHDIDVYVVHEDVPQAAKALDLVGFKDLGEQAPGDRQWIYHSGKRGVIFDVIWRFANLANYITRDWFDRAGRGKFLGLDMCFLPLEELAWVKVFVINRHRCDWPDIMRIVHAQCRNLDWERLLDLLGDHWLLLQGFIAVFDWQHPDSINCIPGNVREELIRRYRKYLANPPEVVGREHLLDPWLHQRADIYAVWRDEQSDD